MHRACTITLLGYIFFMSVSRRWPSEQHQWVEERDRQRRRNHRAARRPNSHRWVWKSLLIVINMHRNGVLAPHLYCAQRSDHWEELAILLFSDGARCCQCSSKACRRCCCFLIKTFTNEMPNICSNLQFFTIKKDLLLSLTLEQNEHR